MRLLKYFGIVFFIILLLPLSALAKGPKVIVLPFETHSSTDISAFRREAMEAIASALDASGAVITGLDTVKEMVLKKGVKRFGEKDAHSIAEKEGADFALLGSIARLGSTTDVDWRIIDLKANAPVAFFYKSSESEQDVLKRIAESGGEMLKKMVSALETRPASRSGVIDEILVYGNNRVDSEAILKKVTSRAKEPFSPDDVKDDLRAVYGTGFFDDVTAVLTDTASGKLLIFNVREMPFIKKVEFNGNSEIKDERVREAITIKENTVLDRVILNENAEKIKALYSEEGYYLARVAAKVETEGEGARVVFKIEEGPAVKVKRIAVIGNKFFTDKEIKGFMTTSEKGFFSVVSGSGKFNEFVFQNDLAVIMSQYFDKGFIQADILDQRVLLSEDKKWFYITIAVTEGEQFSVGGVDVRGELLKTSEELIAKLKLKPGEIFSRSKLSKGIETLVDVYGDEGYAYADIRPVTKVDNEKKTVDITIDLKKNELVYIERVDISGNTRTRDKVIRREVELGEGDLFSSTELKKSRNNLKRLGYFEDVRIGQGQGSASDKMKLDVEVKERPTGSISLGFGYSSVDKLIGTASISQSNFMGSGLKLDVSGTVSGSSSKFIIGFTEPWLFDKPISAGFDIYNTDKQYPDFSLEKKGFDIRFGFPITERYSKGYVTYKLEDVTISEVDEGASTYIKEQEGESTESSVKFSFRRDDRDDAFFPTEGSVVSLSTEFAGGPLGGTSYFVKYEGEAVKYFSLPWGTTFSVHGSLGYVHSYDGREVPIYEKYFLGGINSIRGFETRSIGPKDAETGDVIGGSTMMVANIEYLFPLFSEQSLRGLVFFDAGNSYEQGIDFGDIRTGAGVGVRWYSPLGPLRLELGFNLDPREGESPQQWDFALGTVF
ncbi:MAG: outer membrane protein assembly factor BamA [Deltaproteobacteria bacterium]|nr:outer membrane protein assembly factor BamA [Deltaproteobacteria bacterium]